MNTVAWWTYLAVAVFLTALMAGFQGISSLGALAQLFTVNTLVTCSIALALNALYHSVGKWIALEKKSPPVRVSIHALFIAVGVVAGSELGLRAGQLFMPDFMTRFPRLGVLRVALPISIAVVVVAFGMSKLRTRAKELELREERTKRELLSAQLEALKARTNPHFLFNSLNTVASLIEIDPARAERALEMLSSLFRYALTGSREKYVLLEMELAALENYLAFEELRFQDRLRWSLEIDPELLRAKIPPLILQPLAENAVNHGIASRKEGGRVEVRAKREGDRLVLVVEDDGPGPTGSKHRGSQTSQADLEARLKLAYDDRAQLIRGTGASGGYEARIELPLEIEA